jgi:uncharacterized protein (DUF58 family)
MATSSLARPLESALVFRALRGLYRRRLTLRGHFVLWATLAVALVGIDTRRALVFMLFALAAPPLLLATAQMLRRRPAVRIEGRLPARLTAGRPASGSLEIAPTGEAARGPLSLFFESPLPAAEGLEVRPVEAYLQVEGDSPVRVPVHLHPRRRGRYVLPSLGVAHTDPFGVARSKAVWRPQHVLLAYPRYFTLEELPLPVGRRYQPGGIPLASRVGESLEFVGTREYREGDPLRKIHWPSWARRGEPVVKEYQEEYFSRIALVLDTFRPRRPRPRERERFEAAISLLASVAGHFSRSDEVVDVLAAGPDLYEVSTGRSLGYLDNVLDVLACLEPSAAAPFETVGPALFARLERLTTVVAVMLDWDEAREAFLRRVRAMGVAVRVLLVHEGETRRPWTGAPGEIGDFAPFTPGQIEERLVAEESARGAASTEPGGPAR